MIANLHKNISYSVIKTAVIAIIVSLVHEYIMCTFFSEPSQVKVSWSHFPKKTSIWRTLSLQWAFLQLKSSVYILFFLKKAKACILFMLQVFSRKKFKNKSDYIIVNKQLNFLFWLILFTKSFGRICFTDQQGVHRNHWNRGLYILGQEIR